MRSPEEILAALERGENPTPPEHPGQGYIQRNDGLFSIKIGVIPQFFTVNDTTLYDTAQSDLLRDIRDAVRALSDREPLIADALDDLRKAVEKKDQPSVKKWIRRLSSGTTAAVLKGVAGKTLLGFLGLS